MAKDWEYYKKDHIESQVSSAERWHEWIDENIESPIERIAFMHLIFLSDEAFVPGELVINRQASIGPYRVDFLIVHRETDTWLIVECDGHDFHERTKQQAAHDKKRDRFFVKEGYTVLRYTGSQICENPMEIFEDVGKLIFDREEALKESRKEV